MLNLLNLCNDQLNSLTKYTDSVSVTSGLLGSGFDYCWYRFRSEDSSKSSLSIYISGLYSGSAEVHYESSSDVFEYKGTLLIKKNNDFKLLNIIKWRINKR